MTVKQLFNGFLFFQEVAFRWPKAGKPSMDGFRRPGPNMNLPAAHTIRIIYQTGFWDSD